MLVRGVRVAGFRPCAATGTCSDPSGLRHANLTTITRGENAVRSVALSGLCVRSIDNGICSGRVGGNKVCVATFGPTGRTRANITECSNMAVRGYFIGGMDH